jgi:dihydrofolate synthase / folylpolyglutamate synthase
MRSLQDWLAFIERQHPQPIALGLERVREVLGRLDARLRCPVLTVGGTNGKGSTSAFLETILAAAGYRTALYGSPHLVRYNERVRVGRTECADDALSEAFGAVEAARQGVPLTYFEYGTLAALWLFAREGVEAAVLEVGLGGRLDAVNVVDPDCAVLTSVGIDHVDYLGATREEIGREKAGIFREGRPAVIAEPDPPRTVLEAPGEKFLIGRDFGITVDSGQWAYWGPAGKRSALAHPALRGAVQLRNASAALCALDCVRERLPVSMQDIRRGLAEVQLPGRFQVLPGRPQIVLDVAHNVEAAGVLARNLAAAGYAPETFAVCGMLRDKDLAGVLRELERSVTRWYFCALDGPRAASAQDLAAALAASGSPAQAQLFASPAHALARALGDAGENDKIVVFGSFLTVGEAIQWLNKNRTSTR